MSTTTTRNSLVKPGYADAADIADINTNMDTIDASFAKCNWAGTTAPTGTDDSSKGYAIGSMWFDTTGHKLYIAESVGVATATWRQIDSNGAGYSTPYQFTSTLATGTAPFAVSSTTVNTNLNADTVDGTHASSFALDANVLKKDGSVALTGDWTTNTKNITTTGTLTGNQLASTVATGTAPLTVASTTQVANLNCASLNGIADTGFVKQTLADAKGDLLVASGDNTWAREAVGTNGLILMADSSATNGVSWTSKTGGNLNFITNSDFETDTVGVLPSGYAVYADADSATPTDGTGGSPTVTLLASTTVVISGNKSARLAKDAANRRGEGCSYVMSIPSAWAGRTATISFWYRSSVTLTLGDFVVYGYDVTNASLVTPSSPSVSATSADITKQYTSQIVIPATCASLRLIIHIATTSDSAINLDIDDVCLTMTPLRNSPIYALYTTNAGANIGKNYVSVVVDFEDKVIDTHNAVTTGAAWKFTAPRPGWYSLTANLTVTTAPTGTQQYSIYIYKNGSFYKMMGRYNATVANNTMAGTFGIYLYAGETISVASNTSENADKALIADGDYNYVCIASYG